MLIKRWLFSGISPLTKTSSASGLPQQDRAAYLTITSTGEEVQKKDHQRCEIACTTSLDSSWVFCKVALTLSRPIAGHCSSFVKHWTMAVKMTRRRGAEKPRPPALTLTAGSCIAHWTMRRIRH
jgi:hypothetical protein